MFFLIIVFNLNFICRELSINCSKIPSIVKRLRNCIAIRLKCNAIKIRHYPISNSVHVSVLY